MSKTTINKKMKSLNKFCKDFDSELEDVLELEQDELVMAMDMFDYKPEQKTRVLKQWKKSKRQASKSSLTSEEFSVDSSSIAMSSCADSNWGPISEEFATTDDDDDDDITAATFATAESSATSKSSSKKSKTKKKKTKKKIPKKKTAPKKETKPLLPHGQNTIVLHEAGNRTMEEVLESHSAIVREFKEQYPEMTITTKFAADGTASVTLAAANSTGRAQKVKRTPSMKKTSSSKSLKKTSSNQSLKKTSSSQSLKKAPSNKSVKSAAPKTPKTPKTPKAPKKKVTKKNFQSPMVAAPRRNSAGGSESFLVSPQPRPQQHMQSPSPSPMRGRRPSTLNASMHGNQPMNRPMNNNNLNGSMHGRPMNNNNLNGSMHGRPMNNNSNNLSSSMHGRPKNNTMSNTNNGLSQSVHGRPMNSPMMNNQRRMVNASMHSNYMPTNYMNSSGNNNQSLNGSMHNNYMPMQYNNNGMGQSMHGPNGNMNQMNMNNIFHGGAPPMRNNNNNMMNNNNINANFQRMNGNGLSQSMHGRMNTAGNRPINNGMRTQSLNSSMHGGPQPRRGSMNQPMRNASWGSPKGQMKPGVNPRRNSTMMSPTSKLGGGPTSKQMRRPSAPPAPPKEIFSLFRGDRKK